MLKHWRSHTDYLEFVRTASERLCEQQRTSMLQYRRQRVKLELLDLDVLGERMVSRYSTTGRPALRQPEIFRSLSLMVSIGETSITNWVRRLKYDNLLALLVGCNLDQLPPLGSYYDFIDRLWPVVTDGNLRKPLHKRSGKSPGRNKKLPNRHPDIVKRLVERLVKGRSIPGNPERLIQELFSELAVKPSIDAGLIDSEHLTVAGDGTAVHCHSSANGTRICDCRAHDVTNCDCKR